MRRAGVVLVVAIVVAVAACGGQGRGEGEIAAPPSDPAKVSGGITVLTNRTDQIADGSLKKYAAEFNKIYPGVKVKFEGLTDYEGETKIRMNTENYGDVLLIPTLSPSSSTPTSSHRSAVPSSCRRRSITPTMPR
ncbi:hypothetical protein SMICM304S_11214 [Streptomyces microflavus]